MSIVNSVDLRTEIVEKVALILADRLISAEFRSWVSESSLNEILNSPKTEKTQESRSGLVWENSFRRDLMDIPVGSVRYLSRPRSLSYRQHRNRWGRAAYSLNKLYGAKFSISRTQTGLKVERVA
jgi:hypothetical protein